MNNILIFITSFLNIFLGIIVLLRNKRKIKNILFFLIILCLVTWLISSVFYNYSSSLDNKLFWNRMMFSGPHLLPSLLVLFSYYFPVRKQIHKGLLAFIIIVGIIFFIFFPFSVVAINSDGTRIFGFINKIYPFYFFTFFTWMIINFYFSNIISNAIQKLQLRYLFIGMLITALIAGTTNIILPIFFSNTNFNMMGQISTLFLFGFTAYAILQYRLMDIRVVISRSIIYALLVALTTGGFVFTLFIATNYVAQESKLGQIALLAGASLLIVILLDPLKNLLAKLTNSIFFKAAIDYPVATKRLTDVINEEIKLDQLVIRFSKSLANELRLKEALILLPVGQDIFLAPEELQKNLPGKSKKKKSVFYHSPFIQYLKKNNEILILDELDRKVADSKIKKEREIYDNIRQNLESMNCYAAVPVSSKEGLEAILILSRKLSGEVFSIKDIQLLEVVSPQMASGIQKAKLYQEAKEFNIKLQREVERATHNLRAANEKLTKLDEAKSEFMSIASHQLRTPLAGIIGYLDMLRTGDFGELDKEKKPVIHDLLGASRRLSRLVNIFLNVTRIEAGRFVMNFKKVKMNEIIEAMYKELKPTADKKNVKLTYEKVDLPEVEVDEDKIKDVVLNLVDNAIKYTPEGSVAISTTANQRTVRVKVEDTGVGIDKDEAGKLFNKFVRGSDIARVSPNGSGLGLFIAKKVVEGHGGRVWAESDGKGKGSRFYFEIPIVADAEAKKKTVAVIKKEKK